MNTPEWFVSVDDDGQYEICLETHTGIVPTLSIWFHTYEDAEEYMREFVLSAKEGVVSHA